MCQGCPLQGFGIGRNLQERVSVKHYWKKESRNIYPKLEEKVGRKNPGPKVGKKLKENIL